MVHCCRSRYWLFHINSQLMTILSWRVNYWWSCVDGFEPSKIYDPKLLVNSWKSAVDSSAVDSHVMMDLDCQKLTIKILILHYCWSALESTHLTYQLLMVKCWWIRTIESFISDKRLGRAIILTVMFTYLGWKPSDIEENWKIKSWLCGLSFKRCLTL